MGVPNQGQTQQSHSDGGQFRMKVSLDDFLQLLNEEFPGKDIRADTKVAETGIDSLDLADIVFKMEDKFGAEYSLDINELNIDDEITVGHIFTLVKEHS